MDKTVNIKHRLFWTIIDSKDDFYVNKCLESLLQGLRCLMTNLARIILNVVEFDGSELQSQNTLKLLKLLPVIPNLPFNINLTQCLMYILIQMKQ